MNTPKKSISPTPIPASIARTQLGAILDQVGQGHSRFLITRGGKPAAVLLSVDDFEDLLEEVDPEFRKTMEGAASEHDAGLSLSLADYLKDRVKYQVD